MSVFFRRGIWFSRTMLLEVGIDVFSNDDWHDKICKFPKVLMRVCDIAGVFNNIGERAQDSLVGLILTESSTRASVLTCLERLNNSGALNSRVLSALGHLETRHLNQLIADIAASVDAGTPKDWKGKHVFEYTIAMLKDYSWAAPLEKSLKAKAASLQTEEEDA